MFVEKPDLSLKEIAQAVLKLSDFYIKNPAGSTPWKENFCQIAYRYYYLPLNQIRCYQVFQRGLQVGFFENLEIFIDWGAGPGTASLALTQLTEVKKQIKKQVLFDRDTTPFNIFKDLHQGLIQPKYSIENNLTHFTKSPSTSALICSYSLTEVSQLPKNWEDFEALILIEPSTSEDGRRLLKTRQQLIDQGYFIWAPCTHQKNCSLLNESAHDWCHDRYHVSAPDWFEELESLLPMKNKTITTSYLLARKTAPPKQIANLARLTGDSREEKGKTRQLVCRHDKREFLTWMHKNISPQTFPRGELIKLNENFELKSNELRLKTPCQLITNPFENT